MRNWRSTLTYGGMKSFSVEGRRYFGSLSPYVGYSQFTQATFGPCVPVPLQTPTQADRFLGLRWDVRSGVDLKFQFDSIVSVAIIPAAIADISLVVSAKSAATSLSADQVAQVFAGNASGPRSRGRCSAATSDRRCAAATQTGFVLRKLCPRVCS